MIPAIVAVAACVGDDVTAAPVGATNVDAASETAPGEPNDSGADTQIDAGPRCDRAKPFSSLEELTELNSAASVGNFTPRLTDDGLQLFFARALVDGDVRLFRTKRLSRTVPCRSIRRSRSTGSIDQRTSSTVFRSRSPTEPRSTSSGR